MNANKSTYAPLSVFRKRILLFKSLYLYVLYLWFSHFNWLQRLNEFQWNNYRTIILIECDKWLIDAMKQFSSCLSSFHNSNNITAFENEFSVSFATVLATCLMDLDFVVWEYKNIGSWLIWNHAQSIHFWLMVSKNSSIGMIRMRNKEIRRNSMFSIKWHKCMKWLKQMTISTTTSSTHKMFACFFAHFELKTWNSTWIRNELILWEFALFGFVPRYMNEIENRRYLLEMARHHGSYRMKIKLNDEWQAVSVGLFNSKTMPPLSFV